MAKAKPARPAPPTRRKRGFEAAGRLLQTQLKGPAEKRGFGDTRLLTHWADIVGSEMADMARPVKITYGRGFGGTLIVLTTGSKAPLVEMAKNQIIERVNATYGYRAVSNLHVTQTAPTGFADGQVAFRSAKPSPARRPTQ